MIDSVMRKWLDQARVSGQPVDGSARDGTFGAGCHRITGLMHTLISDMVQLRLEGQKVRIKCCSFRSTLHYNILCVGTSHNGSDMDRDVFRPSSFHLPHTGECESERLRLVRTRSLVSMCSLLSVDMVE